MFIELIELLRCPQPHEETWLVAAFDRVAGRVVVQGRLGCPTCRAEYPIRDGAADLDTHGGDERAGRRADLMAEPLVNAAPDPWRLAALLDLRPPAAVAVLEGGAAAAADAILGIFPGAVVALNPAIGLSPRERLAIVRAPGRVPLRAGTVHGLATTGGDTGLLAEAVRVLRPGGRLVAPAATAVPPGVVEIARDAHDWVAASDLAGPAVPLRRG